MKRYILIVIWVLILVIGYRSYTANKTRTEIDASLSASEALNYFEESVAYDVILAGATADFNEDGVDDVVVVYTDKDENRRFRMVYSTGETYGISEEKAAPMDNQKVEVKNIDDNPPLEFILSGSKNGHYGYSIFRMEGDILVDIFGEGMEDCC